MTAEKTALHAEDMRFNLEAAKLGAFYDRVETDRYGNDVSLIDLVSGPRYRMVHHTKPAYARQRANIYKGRGEFIRVRSFSPSDDCMETWIEVAGYRVEWGDGDNLGCACNPLGPDLAASLCAIREDDFAAAIVTVLHALQGDDACWERKPVTATP